MELEILRFVQSASSPALDRIAQAVTVCGESLFLVLLVCLVLWTVSREKGERAALALLCAMFFCNALKAVFVRPRPIGEAGIRSLRVETATGSSFPSGHASAAGAAYTSLAGAFRKRGAYIAAAVLILLVCLSRLYLGVHWPSDVLFGALLGAGLAAALGRLSYYNVKEKKSAFGILAFASLIAALVSGTPDLVKSAGLCMGAAIALPVEHRYVRFEVWGGRARKAARFLLGAAVVGGAYLGLKAALPEGDFWLYLRHAFVAAAAMLGCPWLFVKLRL